MGQPAPVLESKNINLGETKLHSAIIIKNIRTYGNKPRDRYTECVLMALISHPSDGLTRGILL